MSEAFEAAVARGHELDGYHCRTCTASFWYIEWSFGVVEVFGVALEHTCEQFQTMRVLKTLAQQD